MCSASLVIKETYANQNEMVQHTHNNKNWALCVFVSPALGVWKQKDPWGSLGSSHLGSFQAYERSCF